MLISRSSIFAILGWALLGLGVALYIYPSLFGLLGHQSGLVAFGFIFVGISLLKYRKDQINNKDSIKRNE